MMMASIPMAESTVSGETSENIDAEPTVIGETDVNTMTETRENVTSTSTEGSSYGFSTRPER
jgi:hypothetical protein